MSNDTMMALGEFRFSLATASPDSIQSNEGYTWAEQAVMNSAPALQFTGIDAPTKSLRGRIFPQFRGGLSQLDKMREMGRKGEPLTLVNASGVVLGDWVILSIDQTETLHDKEGNAKRLEFTLNLKRYSA